MDPRRSSRVPSEPEHSQTAVSPSPTRAGPNVRPHVLRGSERDAHIRLSCGAGARQEGRSEKFIKNSSSPDPDALAAAVLPDRRPTATRRHVREMISSRFTGRPGSPSRSQGASRAFGPAREFGGLFYAPVLSFVITAHGPPRIRGFSGLATLFFSI